MARIGGPGHIVLIDETFVAKRKPGNPQGRPVQPQWVFGGVILQLNGVKLTSVSERRKIKKTKIFK